MLPKKQIIPTFVVRIVGRDQSGSPHGRIEHLQSRRTATFANFAQLLVFLEDHITSFPPEESMSEEPPC